MNETPVDKRLVQAVRGKDYRLAFKAIARLRVRHGPEVLGTPRGALDEQRAFQDRVARMVLEQGLAGLASEWTQLGPEQWRANLIFEIGQFLDLWAEPALVEVGLVALNDSHAVQSRAVTTVRHWLPPARDEDLEHGKTQTERRYLPALHAMRRSITPEQRTRMTRAFAAMLWKHRKERYPVLADIVESLGHTARAADADVIEMLEALRPQSGETHKVSYHPLDEATLDERTRMVAERKGIDPSKFKLRIAYTPTGLLDAKVLETALKRIKSRA